MKKLILTAAVSGAMGLSSFAQGYVNFQSLVTTEFYFNSTASTANKVASTALGTQAGAGGVASTGVLDVGLFWSTSAFTDSAQATLAGVATIGGTAGSIAGSTDLAIAGTSPGESVYLQLYAWDSSYATPDAAIAAGGFFGAASAGQVNTTYGAVGAALNIASLAGGSPAPASVIFGTTAPLFGRTILLSQTPEPTTIALGGLGAAALLLFRRRK